MLLENGSGRRYLQICDDFHANLHIKKAEDVYGGAEQEKTEEHIGELPSFVLVSDPMFRQLHGVFGGTDVRRVSYRCEIFNTN